MVILPGSAGNVAALPLIVIAPPCIPGTCNKIARACWGVFDNPKVTA